MKYTLFMLLLPIIISCNSSNDKTSSSNTIRDSSLTQVPVIDTPIAVTPPTRLSKKQLPVVIKFKGNLHEAWQWNDKKGDNLLITSIVPAFADKEKNEYGEEGMSAEIHAFHFVKEGEGYRLLWELTDTEKACSFDLTMSFFKDAVIVTDLDLDGVAETTIQYKKACRSDVSPAYMKLIMHEDTTKYSLRGGMWVFDGGNGKFEVTEKDVNLEKLKKPKGEMEKMYQLYGRYETEKEFANAPPEFLIHARKQWLKYAKESFN